MRTLLLAITLLWSCVGPGPTPADDDVETDAGADASPPPDATPDAGGDEDAGHHEEDPYPNLARVEAPRGFVEQADGTFTIGSGYELRDAARVFYETHPDDFDFVTVWCDFDVRDIWAFTDVLRYDIAGIGSDRVHEILYGRGLGADYTADAGSDGRLQALVFMNGHTQWTRARFDELDILTHEVGHRWGANLMLPWEDDPWILVVDYMSHWNVFVGQGAPSVLSYGETVDNGDGTFTSREVRPMPFSPWDLYVMGLVPPEEVENLFWVRDPHDFDPPRDPFGGEWTGSSRPRDSAVTYVGERVDVSVTQVIEALGPRDPSHEEAQREFRHAFVVLCRPGLPCSDSTLQWVEGVRRAWPERFAWATGDRATVETELE